MVAETISRLIHEYQVDLINMSLGGPASKIVHEHVLEALDHGVLCIASAGNTFGAVEFPAAFREAISVSALGKTGWCPKDTAGSAWIPSRANRFGRGGLYLAAFSAFGSKIDCAGPGNAILSTVPERFGLKAPYASMEGTSMASAAVTGALAVALSKSREYLASPRVRARAVLARKILRDRCRDAGLSPRFQGIGVPAIR
jgi:subtilisin family serine protease